jgi:hypothetical protein
VNIIRSAALAASLSAAIPQVGLAQTTTGGRVGPGPLGSERITLQLQSANARFVFQMLAEVMNVTLDIDPSIDQLLTLKLTQVSGQTMLAALCDSMGYQCRVSDKTLVVRRPSSTGPGGGSAGSKDASGRGSIKLQRAALLDALNAIFALVPDGGYVMDQSLAGRSVDVDARDATWQEALDAVCASAGCRWERVVDTPPVIRVRPR